MAACFDGYKMVALGVTGEAVADKAAGLPAIVQGSMKEDRSLRNTALWYPDIPQRDWHLNEDCFTGKDTPVSEFRPLCYTWFGGHGGTRHQRLQQISVSYRSTRIKAIDFHYSKDEVQRLGLPQLSGHEEVLTFHIDGSQGETIENIDVDLDLRFVDHTGPASFPKHGLLRSFRISTNWGRHKHFRPSLGSKDPPFSLSPMGPAPETKVTGLYAALDHMYGLISLGVISELISRPPKGEGKALRTTPMGH
ncbi:MAG: hypothetical protein M4579_000379 [Chaenotheca gracillima]|nr:MAG: hypothetical protein M4579_000379 [Chaenotheca gracillima]